MCKRRSASLLFLHYLRHSHFDEASLSGGVHCCVDQLVSRRDQPVFGNLENPQQNEQTVTLVKKILVFCAW